MTYHMFETELKSVSAFNGEALRWMAIGSFLANCLIAVIIGFGFAGKPLSEFGAFMFYRASWFLGVLSLMCFGFGGWAILTKNSVIEQIKRETIGDSQSKLNDTQEL